MTNITLDSRLDIAGCSALQNMANMGCGIIIHQNFSDDKRYKTPVFYARIGKTKISPVLDYANLNSFLLGYRRHVVRTRETGREHTPQEGRYIMNNRDEFQRHLEAAYIDLFENDPEYAYARARKSPEALADVMTASLAIGEANTDGAGIRRACKAVGISQTRKAITAYLNPTIPQ